MPRDIQAEIAVLKGIVAAFVMSRNTRQPIYSQQREVLASLADTLWESGDAHLDLGFAEDWRAADDVARRRAVVDQVASLTDQSALAWYERLVNGDSPDRPRRGIRGIGLPSWPAGFDRATSTRSRPAPTSPTSSASTSR